MEMIKTSHIVFIFLIISTTYQFKDEQLCSNCTSSHHVYYTDDTAVKYINGNITDFQSNRPQNESQIGSKK
jgi:hypothetical protein